MAVSARHFEAMAGDILHDHEVSQAEFGRRVGCSRQNISKLVLAGKIKKNARGKLDFYSALKDYEENTDRSHHERLSKNLDISDKPESDQGEVKNNTDNGFSSAENPAEQTGYKHHRNNREEANAKLARLKADQLAGELISADQVEKDAFNMARGLRDAILSVPDRVAPVLAAQSNDREVAKILTEELEKALNGLINSMNSKSVNG